MVLLIARRSVGEGRETCPMVLFLINKERALGSFMPSCFSYLLDVANDGTNGKSRPEADDEVTKQREFSIHAQQNKKRSRKMKDFSDGPYASPSFRNPTTDDDDDRHHHCLDLPRAAT